MKMMTSCLTGIVGGLPVAGGVEEKGDELEQAEEAGAQDNLRHRPLHTAQHLHNRDSTV